MLTLRDERWNTLLAGYRTPYDLRPALARLESERDVSAVWHELWNELHRQGDVDLASYAAVSRLVRICHQHPCKDYTPYAIVTVIELARKRGTNPDTPAWLADGHFASIQELATPGLHELRQSSNPELVQTILAILALAMGLRTYARIFLENSEEELLDLETKALSRS